MSERFIGRHGTFWARSPAAQEVEATGAFLGKATSHPSAARTIVTHEKGGGGRLARRSCPRRLRGSDAIRRRAASGGHARDAAEHWRPPARGAGGVGHADSVPARRGRPYEIRRATGKHHLLRGLTRPSRSSPAR